MDDVHAISGRHCHYIRVYEIIRNARHGESKDRQCMMCGAVASCNSASEWMRLNKQAEMLHSSRFVLSVRWTLTRTARSAVLSFQKQELVGYPREQRIKGWRDQSSSVSPRDLSCQNLGNLIDLVGLMGSSRADGSMCSYCTLQGWWLEKRNYMDFEPPEEALLVLAMKECSERETWFQPFIPSEIIRWTAISVIEVTGRLFTHLDEIIPQQDPLLWSFHLL